MRVAFTTNPGTGGQLWAARADGAGVPERVVAPIATQPAWSADGRQLAFSAFRGGNWDIYARALDTGVETRVTSDAAPDYAPAWSPDGSQIAFYRFDDGAKRGRIMVARIDGTGERVLAAAGNEGMPQWSPDGRRLVFQSHRDGNWEIYVMQADGSGQTRVTVTPDRHEGEPSWSPDGASIVFSAGVGERRDIYAIRPDGAAERRLTNLQLQLWGPRVSPDGRRIAFFEFPPGHIYVANADGSGVTRLFGP